MPEFNFIDALGKKQFGEMVKKELGKCLDDCTILIPNFKGEYLRTIPLSVKDLWRRLN